MGFFSLPSKKGLNRQLGLNRTLWRVALILSAIIGSSWGMDIPFYVYGPVIIIILFIPLSVYVRRHLPDEETNSPPDAEDEAAQPEIAEED